MAFVQGAKNQGAAVTTLAATFPGAVTAGHLLVAGIQVANTSGITVADNVNAGNYSVSDNHSTGNTADDLALFYKENTGAGTPTVTFSSIPAGNAVIVIGEYSGPLTAASLDVHGATDANGTSITSGSQTTTGANGDQLVAIISLSTQNVTITNTTSGWAVDETNSPNATESSALASSVQAASGAFTTTFNVTGSAQDMSVLVASFKLAAVAVPGGTIIPMRPFKLGPLSGHWWSQQMVLQIQSPRGDVQVSPLPPYRLGPLSKHFSLQQRVNAPPGGVQNLVKTLTAILSFTGPTNLANAITKGITGGLSFSGAALTNAITKALAATLSFSGALTRAITKGMTAAVLSFTGALSRAVGKTLAAATLSFSGAALKNAITKGMTGTLSFSGAALKNAITKGLAAATLSFSGAVTKATTKTLAAATLTFSGALTSGRQFVRTLTATLSFAGSLATSYTKVVLRRWMANKRGWRHF